MIDLRTRGKGAIKNPTDLRDYKLVLSSAKLPDEFSVKDKISKIKDQNGSSSCVGQAFSYYAEVLNKIETSKEIQLSARDIYSLIYQDEGGAFIRDGAKKICDSGVITEEDAPSYHNGNPPSEQFMRSRNDISPEEVEEGKTYLAKKYVTFDNKRWNTFKQAIYQGNGCISGAYGNNYCWNNEILQVPEKGQLDWGHCIFFTGWKIVNGVEYLEFVNSWSDQWGNKGFGLMPKEYVDAGYVFNPVTLVDAQNGFYTTASKTVSILQALINAYRLLIEKIKAGFGNLYNTSFEDWQKGRNKISLNNK